MITSINGIPIYTSPYVGDSKTIVISVPVPRRGFSVRTRRTVFVANGSYILSGEMIICHPDDLGKIVEASMDVEKGERCLNLR